jgi:hypothetical protein
MGKGIVLFLVLLLSGFAANSLMLQHAHAAAGHGKTDFAKHFEDSTLLFTEKEMFGVELVIPNERLSTGINEIDCRKWDMVLFHPMRWRKKAEGYTLFPTSSWSWAVTGSCGSILKRVIWKTG